MPVGRGARLRLVLGHSLGRLNRSMQLTVATTKLYGRHLPPPTAISRQLGGWE